MFVNFLSFYFVLRPNERSCHLTYMDILSLRSLGCCVGLWEDLVDTRVLLSSALEGHRLLKARPGGDVSGGYIGVARRRGLGDSCRGLWWVAGY